MALSTGHYVFPQCKQAGMIYVISLSVSIASYMNSEREGGGDFLGFVTNNNGAIKNFKSINTEPAFVNELFSYVTYS